MEGERTETETYSWARVQDDEVGSGTKLAEIVAPINARGQDPTPDMAFDMFVTTVYLPFYGRKWKRSTMMSNHDRVERYLVSEFGAHKLGGFRRDELQDFLDRREADGLSYSTVAHLRWDMRQIFRMAVAEGFIQRNPADLLFVPRGCPRPNTRDMTADEVMLMFSVLDLRELLIAKLGVLAGMRPGEIFALDWGSLEGNMPISDRAFTGPHRHAEDDRSVRRAALAEGLRGTIELWRAASGNPRPTLGFSL